MNIPDSLKYTKTHEWARIEGDVLVMGITDHAQHELTDIVYVDDFPDIGSRVQKGRTVAVIESVKAVAEVFAVVSGELLAINAALEDSPELLNKEPYDAWIAKIKISNLEEIEDLLSPDAYKKELTA
ncbi:MAG: glycine cleavage system protein GcvH [Candidatus Lokiarchaeota archaeon]|nr:glycine cleavage system protein GcvH [Candidatus Lokiarchaeota archaeon]